MSKKMSDINQQKWQRMRLIIKKLQEGPLTFNEVCRLFNHGIENRTLQRTLQNYLAELVNLGLTIYKNGYYHWHETRQVFKTKDEYHLAIAHSQSLVPALQSMFGILSIDRLEEPDLHPLYNYAKQHLKAYPETYKKLEQLEQAFEKGDVLTLAPGFPTQTELKQVQHLIEISWHDVPKEEEPKIFKIYKSFVGDISLLTLKVKHGQPLQGRCDLCPIIQIKGGE